MLFLFITDVLRPRFAFLIWWLLAPVRVNAAFAQFNFPWLVGIAGLLFSAVDSLDVYDCLSAEWLGLAMDRAGA